MANRTFEFFGRGYGSEPVEITASIDGINVYSGPVTTVNGPETEWADQVLLFTGGEIPTAFQGSVPVSISVTSGTLVLAWVNSNYTQTMPNPIFSSAEYAILTSPTSSPEEQTAIYAAHAVPSFSEFEIAELNNPATSTELYVDILKSHSVLSDIGNPEIFDTGFYEGDCKTNVAINGIPETAPDPRPSDAQGDWFWSVAGPGTITFDLNMLPGNVS